MSSMLWPMLGLDMCIYINLSKIIAHQWILEFKQGKR